LWNFVFSLSDRIYFYQNQLNPQRELPVIDDDGFLLSEHVTIMQYICDKFAPNSPLYPKDPQQRAIVNHRLVFNTTFFYSAVSAHIVGPMFFDYPQTEKGAMRLNTSRLQISRSLAQ
jgi:glutathione S-transferase